MTKWAGLEAEIEGVRKACRNLDNPRQVASYIYDRANEYAGPMHKDVTVDLTVTALKELENAHD